MVHIEYECFECEPRIIVPAIHHLTRSQHFGLKVGRGFSQIDQIDAVRSRDIRYFSVEPEPVRLIHTIRKLMGQQNGEVKIAFGALPGGSPTAETVYGLGCREGGKDGIYCCIYFTHFESHVQKYEIATHGGDDTLDAAYIRGVAMSKLSGFRGGWLLAGAAFALSILLVPRSQAEDAGNLYNTLVDIRLGERYFERQCGRCHGFDATGNDEAGGPDLTGRLTRASTDVAVFNIIRDGIPGTAMLPVPEDVPDPQVWQLVAYLDSLRYDPGSVVLAGDAESGNDLFWSGSDCADCHMVSGRGARFGPDLSRIGENRTPDDLLADMINPQEDVAPRWWRLRVTGPDGVTREGYRMNEDSFSVRIMDDDENLWSFHKDSLQSYERIEESTMPSYAQSLSESELDDLVAYLFSLRREEI